MDVPIHHEWLHCENSENNKHEKNSYLNTGLK